MDTYIIMVGVSYHGARKLCESLENVLYVPPQSYKGLPEVYILESTIENHPDVPIMVVTISDFMNMVNDEEDFSNVFISYVRYAKN